MRILAVRRLAGNRAEFRVSAFASAKRDNRGFLPHGFGPIFERRKCAAILGGPDRSITPGNARHIVSATPAATRLEGAGVSRHAAPGRLAKLGHADSGVGAQAKRDAGPRSKFILIEMT